MAITRISSLLHSPDCSRIGIQQQHTCARANHILFFEGDQRTIVPEQVHQQFCRVALTLCVQGNDNSRDWKARTVVRQKSSSSIKGTTERQPKELSKIIVEGLNNDTEDKQHETRYCEIQNDPDPVESKGTFCARGQPNAAAAVPRSGLTRRTLRKRGHVPVGVRRS